MSRALVLGALLLGSGACLTPAETTCADGALCPAGSTCASGGACAPDALVAACDGAGKVDGDPCDVGGVDNGACVGGVCTPVTCGNGEVVAPEECEPGQLGDATCADVGFYRGDLGCTATCEYDTSGCAGRCGDGVLDEVEVCDSVVPVSCAGFGFDAGRPACSSACLVDVSPCQTIGLAPGLTADVPLRQVWVASTGELYAIGDDVLYARRGLVVDEQETPDQAKGLGTWIGLAGCAAGDAWAARRVASQIGIITYFAHGVAATWSPTGDAVERNTSVIGCTRDGVVFASTPTGFGPAEPAGTLHRYDGVTLTALPPVGRAVYALRDTDAGLEAGTEDGVWRLVDDAWVQIALPGNTITALQAAGAARWAGDASGVLHAFDGATWQALPLAPGILQEVVLVGDVPLARDEAGALWLHDGAGPVQLAVDAYVTGIAADGAALQVVAGGVLNTLQRDWGRVAYAPASGRPFVARDGALWTFGPGITRAGVTLNADDFVRAIWESPDGTVWIEGTFDRYRWRDGVFTSRAPQPGMLDDVRAATGADYDHYLRLFYPFSYPPTPTGQVQQVDGDDVTTVIGAGILGLWGPGDGTAYAVGVGGQVQYFDGAAWSLVDVGVTADLVDVWGTGPADVWIAGAAGLALHWDGTTWTTLPGSLGAALQRVRADGDQVYVLTSAGSVYAGDALGWTPVRGITGATDLALRGTEVFAATSGGLRVLRSVTP